MKRFSAFFYVGTVCVGLVGCDSTPPNLADASVEVVDDGAQDAADARDLGSSDTLGDSSDGSTLAPTPSVIALSTSGHDRLYAVAYGLDGNIYATGQSGSTIESVADYSILLVRFRPDGTLDSSFGTAGVVTQNVTVGGRALEVGRAMVVQSTGRIVVLGAAEHDPAASGLLAGDTDIVLLGFLPDGMLDSTFGDDGIVRLDLGTGDIGQNTMGDVLRGQDDAFAVSLDRDDHLFIHGLTRAPEAGQRIDQDWAVLRLLANGERDTAWGGGDGLVTLDIGQADARARGITVLADGSVVATGYTTSMLGQVASAQQPVLFKLTPSGDFDTTFANQDATTLPGVWYDFTVDMMNAEAYAASPQGSSFITVGYGPSRLPGTMGTDIVSFRFTAAGNLDATYGTAGATFLDVGGYGDNGRFMVTLPDNRTLSVGAGRAMPAVPPSSGMPEQDALVLVLEENGALDTSFGARGHRLYDLGGNDHFWGAAVNAAGSRVAVVGIAAAEVAGTDDDDSAILILPIE